MIFIIFLSYSTFYMVYSQDGQYFGVTDNMKILVDQNSVLDTLTADSILICSHRCQLHSECKNANYMAETGECQLLVEIDDRDINQQSEDAEGFIKLTKFQCSSDSSEDTESSSSNGITKTDDKVSFTSEITPENGKLLGSFPKQTKSWKIEMDIKVLSTGTSTSTNILRMVEKESGSLLNNPGLMLHKSSPDVMLKLATDGQPNKSLGKVATLKLNQFVHLSIKVERDLIKTNHHKLTVHVDFVQSFERIHSHAETYVDVELYFSSGSSKAANVVVKNFVFENLGE
ncbi:uncharacterized protein [Clytia hemisphaerica]|uniref:Apple domain-containing protein n=1 Tax=Clytia hemisphaerica TaxID=252671 RepID=A0A7M5WSR9_9CNID